MFERQDTPRYGARTVGFLLASVAVFAMGRAVVTGEPKPSVGTEVKPPGTSPTDAAAADAPSAAPVIDVPEGFVVELVAGPPLVSHPMMAGFDDRGRLYVADALGVNLNAEELQRDLPNRIQRLEDTDDDGRFDRATTFADKMTFPMGAVWHRGAIYTASPPYIWRLEDIDDDGVADRREQIVGKFGFIGNAADIHGCFLGPEGRIYWCDGRHGHEFVDANGETLSKGQAARIFSCHPDGSDVQVYAGGGMDNPVEIAFTAEGEMLGTMTFYNPDEVRHDALVHYAYGGVYPRKHPVVDEFKRTGDFMPALSLYGTVAPAGLTRYSHTALGAEYTDNFFSVQFNTHKVLRHKLTREGSSFVAEDEDFLTSPSVDFHPTDVLEDADGSLLVIDTGGWFRHGCPTSQIAKPEILGAIYRIRRVGAPVDDDPRGRHLPWRDATNDELALRLSDERPAVRERAVDALAQRGHAAVPVLTRLLHGGDAKVRRRAVWTLSRIGTSEARAAVRGALDDEEWSVRLSAARSVSATRDPAARSVLEQRLNDKNTAVAREAATALGRIGKSNSVPALLHAANLTTNDRHFEHALIFALIQIGDRDQTIPGLAYSYPADAQRVALIALDQMSPGDLDSSLVTPLLDSADLSLQRAALEVLSRHRGWSGEILTLVSKWLANPDPKDEETTMLRGAVIAFADNAHLQTMVSDTIDGGTAPKPTQLAILESMSRSDLLTLPNAWVSSLASSLQANDDEIVEQTIKTLRMVGGDHLLAELADLAADETRSKTSRRAAACALARAGQPLSTPLFLLLLETLDPMTGPLERMEAASVLGDAKLDSDQLRILLQKMVNLGPLEIPALTRAFRETDDTAIKAQLKEILTRVDNFAFIDKTLFGELFPTAKGVSNFQSFDDRSVRLKALAAQLTDGDPHRGREVFYGAKAACAACHRIKNDGALIGPDLTHIGAIREPRDLLESIVAPSASFARGYETFTVLTKTGLHHRGIITRETATAVYLRAADRSEIRVARDDVETMLPSPLSVMPEGLDRLVTTDDLRDLIAYLYSLK